MKPTITPTAKDIGLAILLLIVGVSAPHLRAQTQYAIAPTPFQTAFDNAGHIINNACIWTYAAGTTTPITTYADNAGTPNSNPIRTDGTGRFTAYLIAGTVYKFVYESACTPPGHGTTLRTADNIGGVPTTQNPTAILNTVNVRMTLTSGTPVTTSDVTGATTIYIEPYQGSRIALYDGTTWNVRPAAATSFSVPATTSTMYDVFVYDNGGVATYETLAWTNDTTRATGLGLQDGVLVKAAVATRRYLGTFRTTTVSGQTEDSAVKRYVWNYYNRVPRVLQKIEATGSWTYTTATWRQANAAAANQVELVHGWLEATLWVSVQATATNTNAGVGINVGIGEDSTTTPLASSIALIQVQVANTLLSNTAIVNKTPALGRHTYVWLEASQAAGTTTFFGSTNTVGGQTFANGLNGWWWG